MNETKATPSPPIRCAHREVWPVEKFVEHPRNPNRHPESQLQLLGKIILAAGWRAPICVSSRSGFVVKGHGRLQAAKLVGLREAPVDVQEYASESEEWQDMVADNRLAELAEMSLPDLGDLLRELHSTGGSPELAGFTGEELLALIIREPTQLTKLEPPPPPKFAWTLVGIELTRFSEINAHIEAIAKVPGTFCESTYNDDATNGQPQPSRKA